jgi:hypothetical protein
LFTSSIFCPKDEGKYAFKAIQTYDNDDKVKWTGKENSEHPAPTLQYLLIFHLLHLLHLHSF